MLEEKNVEKKEEIEELLTKRRLYQNVKKNYPTIIVNIVVPRAPIILVSGVATIAPIAPPFVAICYNDLVRNVRMEE